jgi:hypothetical protein
MLLQLLKGPANLAFTPQIKLCEALGSFQTYPLIQSQSKNNFLPVNLCIAIKM